MFAGGYWGNTGTGGQVTVAVEYGRIIDVEDAIIAIESDIEIILLDDDEIEAIIGEVLEVSDDDTSLQG